MDWNDTIIVTLHADKLGKLVIPRSVVKGVSTRTKRDYTGGAATDKEICLVHVCIAWASSVGMNISYAQKHETVIQLEVDTDFKIVLDLLRGSKAAEILF